ncbi:MAG: hypothetical protein OXI67_03425 [Candidatus Poribacteria bacterium]|nr:hypothetical protein [Candidatus Poribacteria bacterium]
MKTLGNKITLNLDGNAEVSVKAFIAPIEYTQYNFHVEWDELANFRVAEPAKQYSASVFQAFLPSESVAVGECWQIKEENVLTLLKQLYPNPKLRLQNDDEEYTGIWACLRAHNDTLAEIAFRVHAEFIMEKGKFTPSQFAGHLVIDRIQQKIVSFKMFVPPTTLNFDAGWKQEDGNYFAEIGYCPQIQLCAGLYPTDVEYKTSITQEQAERTLISHYYMFHKINWVSLVEAFELAPVQQKPIHVVSLDGPLFDESC